MYMEKTSATIHRGGCQCGAVRYEVEGTPLVVAHCHCQACQRGSGAGHSTGAMFPDDRFRLTGRVAEFRYESDNGNQVARHFCPVCGSPVYGRNSGTTGYVTVTLGTVDDSSGFDPQVTVFARNRNVWDHVDEGLVTFEAQPDWKPETNNG